MLLLIKLKQRRFGFFFFLILLKYFNYYQKKKAKGNVDIPLPPKIKNVTDTLSGYPKQSD